MNHCWGNVEQNRLSRESACICFIHIPDSVSVCEWVNEQEHLNGHQRSIWLRHWLRAGFGKQPTEAISNIRRDMRCFTSSLRPMMFSYECYCDSTEPRTSPSPLHCYALVNRRVLKLLLTLVIAVINSLTNAQMNLAVVCFSNDNWKKNTFLNLILFWFLC